MDIIIIGLLDYRQIFCLFLIPFVAVEFLVMLLS